MSEKRGPLAFVRRIVGKVDGVLVSVEARIDRPSVDAARSKKFAQRCVKLREEMRIVAIRRDEAMELAAQESLASIQLRTENEGLEDRVESLETDLEASKRAYQERAERVRRDMQRQLDAVSPKLKEAAAIVNRQNAELQEFRANRQKGHDPGGVRIIDALAEIVRLKKIAETFRTEIVKLQERATAHRSLGSMGRLEEALDMALNNNAGLEERVRVAELLAEKYRLEKSKAYTKLSEVMCGSVDVWVTRMAGADYVQIWAVQPHWKGGDYMGSGRWAGVGGMAIPIKTDDPKGYMRIGRLDMRGPGS